MSRSIWTTKGATLSNKSAFKEYGLTWDEIVEAIKEGKLQYRQNSAHGNPFLRLLRSEVEALVNEKHGPDFLKQKKLNKELKQIKRDIKKRKAELKTLETRKAEVLAELGE
ncbi:MAG: hypothetical protein ACPGWR_05555 [Ardenticatenaceae bacterium]